MNGKISDYTEIINIYNDEGQSKAYTYIRERFAVKNPYCVIKRMKQSVIYNYDKETDRFLYKADGDADEVFLGLDELCNRDTSAGSYLVKPTQPSMEELVKKLIEDRLLELSRYIQMNQSSRTVMVDHSSMIADGYHVVLH